MRFNPAPTPEPAAPARPVERDPKAKATKAKGRDLIADIPDATLAFMLFTAAGRSADLGKCSAAVPQARKDFAKWSATQPPCADWRVAFHTFAQTQSAKVRLDEARPPAPPANPPVDTTPPEVAAVFGPHLPNLRTVATHLWLRRKQTA